MILANHPRRRAGVPAAGLSRLLAAGALVAVASSGCRPEDTWNPFAQRTESRPSERTLPTVTDRLQKAYPELSSGRFLVLADLETPQQGQLFILLTPSDRGMVHVSSARSRPETGAGSLEVFFSSADDVLVARDDPEADWSLVSDWSAYKLLLLSVYNPGRAGMLNLEILGQDADVGYAEEGFALAQGWNTLRVDLAEVSQWVDLRRVGQIRCRLGDNSAPVTLFFDDFVLADNRAELWGSPDGPPGEAYVVHEGQRIRVGSGGRFELVFANGEIVAWYDLHRDPARERNCVNWPGTGRAVLGPTPVVLRAGRDVPEESQRADLGRASDRRLSEGEIDLDGDRGWLSMGRQVSVRQRVVEVGALRTVIECERVIPLEPGSATAAPDTPSADDSVAETARIVIRYTVTPLGRVFVSVDCPTVLGSLRVEEMGIAFTCAYQGGFEPLCHSAPLELPTADTIPASFVLFARGRHRSGTSDLLCVPHDPDTLPDAVHLEGGDDDRVGAMFVTSRLGRPRQSWAMMLVVWPDDIDDQQAGQLLAADYTRPPKLTVEVGRLVRTDPGDLNNDGFNEAEGCYVVEPEGNRARLRLNVDGPPCWYPMLKLAGTAGRRLWAYADGDILDTDSRSANGSVLVALNRVVNKPVNVEVVIQADPASAEAEAAGATPSADP